MNYRYRADEEMKDSGIGFEEKIPSDWKIGRAQYYFNVYAGGTPSTNEPTYWDGDIPWINSGEVQNCIVKNISRYITERGLKESSTKLIPKNTALLAMTGATCGKVGYLTFDSTANQSVMAFTEPKNCNSKFLFYYLTCQNNQIECFKTGGAQGGINVDNGKKLYINIPSKMEQEKIARFLDEKTAQFDSIISKKEVLIDKLEEAKKSLISEVVTGKVKVVKTDYGYELVERKEEEMKDSRVEWVKKIPTHWNVINGRRAFAQRKDKAFEDDEQLTASQKYGVILQKEYMQLENQKVVQVEKDFSILKHVEPNDFVISMRSFQGGLEYSTIRGCISSAYVMLIPNNDVYSPFFRWFFKSEQYINALQSTSNLVRDGQAMRFSNFIQIPIFMFCKEEQKKLAEYLNYSVENISKLINTTSLQIEKLKEAKQSLISEAVTGKIEILD